MRPELGAKPIAPMPLKDSDPSEDTLNEMLVKAGRTEGLGDFAQAETQLLDALRFARTAFGERSLFSANALLRVGSFYNRREKHFSARPFFAELTNILNIRFIENSNLSCTSMIKQPQTPDRMAEPMKASRELRNVENVDVPV